jgi:hypothetical protein
MAAAGCASTQLNYNTLDLASTVDRLVRDQILTNLSNFLDSPAAIPSQVVIQSGTTATTNSVSPSFTDPLTSAVQATSTLAQTVSSSVSTTTTRSEQSTRSGKSATISGTNSGTQTWSIDPVTEDGSMRRLRALYMFAVGDLKKNELLTAYPLQYKSIAEKPDKVILDRQLLKKPACVLCEDRESAKAANNFLKVESTVLTVNEKLEAGWLRWVNVQGNSSRPDNPPRGPGAISLGRYGNYELFVDRKDADKFSEFVMFVMTATGHTGGGSDGSSRGGRPKPLGAIMLIQG